MQDIMEFRNVEKTFSDVKALKGVNFNIPHHAIFGLLGPNGAGKTTLIRIITRILAADAGEILFNGENIRMQRSGAIGYMPEEKGMYKKMKVGEHLIYLAALKGMKKNAAREKIEYWFNRLEINGWWHKKVGDLSKGMQQKVQFIATVLHGPQLLILDEPFSGLDPVNSELIKNEIFNLHKEGTTIIFSTHRMEQVEEICGHIALINKGNVVINGNVKAIKQGFKENKFRVSFDQEATVASNDLFNIVAEEPGSMIVQLNQAVSHNRLLRYFIEKDIEVNAFHEILPSINEIFISLVKDDNRA